MGTRMERFEAGFRQGAEDPLVEWAERLAVAARAVLQPVIYGMLLAGPGVAVLPRDRVHLAIALLLVAMQGVFPELTKTGQESARPYLVGVAAFAVAVGFSDQPSAIEVGALAMATARSASLPWHVSFLAVVGAHAAVFFGSLYGRSEFTVITLREPTLANALNDTLRLFFLLQVLLTLRFFRRDITRRKEEVERLSAERDEAMRRAVEQERAGIARELHDVVAHHVSLMVVQAEGAASVLPNDPARAATAVDQIARIGRQAMAELRRLLGVLRPAHEETSSAALAPQPSLADLGALISEMRAAGVDVTIERQGEERVLPPGLQLSIYRVVQEALTNTLKHAGPTSATVRLTHTGQAVEVVVEDDGSTRRGGAITAPEGAGQGLVGMRERVALFGGEIDAAPREDGRGFRVRARFPLASQPA